MQATNNTSIVGATSQGDATRYSTIMGRIKHLSEELLNDKITKALVEREIKIIELCCRGQNDKLFKTSLKQVKNIFKDYYNRKTYVATNISEIADEYSFEKLNPIVKTLCGKVKEILEDISEYIKHNNKVELAMLGEYKTKLTKLYDIIIDTITENDDIVKDLLIELNDTIEKINQTQDTIDLLVKKELISLQLKEFQGNLTENTDNAKNLQDLISSAENFDVFEKIPSIYKQATEKYLLSINADIHNFDYDLGHVRLCDKNSENKEKVAKKVAIAKLEALKSSIIDLAGKLEQINDIRIS